jgi:hypothetical protein
MTRAFAFAAVVLLAGAATLPAQSGFRDRAFGRPESEWCRDDGRAAHCEVREDTLPGLSSIGVDASPNGGIAVRGWNRAETHLRTKITAHADDPSAAAALASQVRVLTDGGRIRAEGPDTRRREWWTASFELEVPQQARLQLTANNGGISLADFAGSGRFETTNGGIALEDVSGDLRGQTVNGGISVRVTGRQWRGAGLDVETQNGGITMSLPDPFNAVLDIATVNGGVNVDFPIVVQGRLDNRNQHIVTTLGSGGPRLRASTVNGGVRINRR